MWDAIIPGMLLIISNHTVIVILDLIVYCIILVMLAMVLWPGNVESVGITPNDTIYNLIYWVHPTPSNKPHQEYYVFSRESRPKPSFATVWRGVD